MPVTAPSRRRILTLATVLLSLHTSSSAQGLADLMQQTQRALVADHSVVWIEHKPSIEDGGVPAGGENWIPLQDQVLHIPGNSHAAWLRFTVPAQRSAERWYLELPVPSLPAGTLYMQDREGRWHREAAGVRIPVSKWPAPHRYPLLPLSTSPGQTSSFLLRLQSDRELSVPVSLVSESALSRSELRTSLALGVYFGLAALTAVVALGMSLLVRDAAHASSAAYVVIATFAQAAVLGVAGLHLWPNQAWWNEVSAPVLTTLAGGSLLLMLTRILSIRDRSRRLQAALLATALSCLPAAFAVAFLSPGPRYLVMGLYYAAASVAALFSLLWSARRGDRFAYPLLFGSAPLYLAGGISVLRAVGLAVPTFWSLHAIQVATAFQWPVLILVLTHRIAVRREIERRLQGLERIDPATGLVNELEFTQRLTRMIARSDRLGYQSAVVLVDIVNVDQMERDFSRPSAGELPIRVAERLLRSSRKIDTVGRLSTYRFGMLIEGPLSPTDAAAIGPRIVAHCLMPFDRKPLHWQPKVHVAKTLVCAAIEPGTVLSILSRRLACVSPDSKRAVFIVAPEVIQSAYQRGLNRAGNLGDSLV